MNLKRTGGWFLACAPLISLAGPASAQSMSLGNASSLLAATGATDESKNLLRYIFGSFSDNPFSGFGSPPTSLLGNLFLYLNMFVFLIASLWTVYTITSGVVSTAHEGKFLGKRYSTVWYPIRLVWGAATLVPVFGGFSLGQAIYMFFTLISVGAANTLAGVAVLSTATFTAMVPAPSGLPASTLLQSSIAEQMFYMWLCAETLAAQPLNQPDSMMQVTALGTANGAAPSSPSGSGMSVQNIGVQLGTAAQPDECGSAGVSLANSAAVVGSNSSLFGFKVDSVDYSAIVTAIQNNVQQAHQSAMFALSSTMQGLATSWYQSYLTSKNAGSGNQIVPFPYAQIQAAKTQYDATVTQALQQAAAVSGLSSITLSALYNMQQMGWVGLGTWYQTFAEVNGAVADASKVNFVFSKPHSDDSAWEEVDDEATKAKRLVYTAGRDGSGGENGFSPSKAISYMQTLLCDNTTGNLSIGQCLLHGMQWLTFQNTGGSQLVNPVIAAKNLGDTLMVAGETLWGVSALAAAETDDSGYNLIGKAAKIVADTVTDGQTAVLREVIQAAVRIVITFAGIIFSIGLVLSIYVPLIPFITWFSAVLTWLAVVVEAIISAPLWSLVHGEGEGEGMGQRTQHGYLFLMNVTFRAPLMVLSFFVASAMTIIGGTLLYATFGSAFANASGNSIVGLASIVGGLVVLTGLMILVVQTSFNLIHLIPDQVLGWLGGNLGAHLGREMEGRIHGMFLAGGRNLQTSVSGAIQKPQRPSSQPHGGSLGSTKDKA
ncbi:DotA/TraY family protein [Paraburkholderia phenazinium]|uniref:Conjugal transfer/type IV secretion protein DotA/TraY n=1 Tax=Paraburkholderia phenazinium TaxID=60549 RepID=A0A1N6KYD7_9BURK|nr:DotA/TraY family protein [Paraburkholderia phenazinium]SIO61558.1 conjugal transfer/type IV secretion protein DotA/TraY [Paraburkholderia phenazinium]